MSKAIEKQSSAQALAVNDDTYPALGGQGFAAMAEAAKEAGVTFGIGDMTSYKLAGPEASEFKVGGDLDSENAKAVTGIVVHAQPTRAYFATGYNPKSQTKQKPACRSFDGKTGEPADAAAARAGGYGGVCATCRMNEWGSAPPVNGEARNGKACSERMNLFVLEQGQAMPSRVAVPPTSLKHWSSYVKALIKSGLRSGRAMAHTVVTKITASGGALVFTRVGELDDAGVTQVVAFRETAMSSMRAAAADAHDDSDVGDAAPGVGSASAADTDESPFM